MQLLANIRALYKFKKTLIGCIVMVASLAHLLQGKINYDFLQNFTENFMICGKGQGSVNLPKNVDNGLPLRYCKIALFCCSLLCCFV